MVVVGIGQCSLDTLAVVDSFPEANTKKEVLSWEEQGGGPVATALVALSRLGIACRFYGIIGDDRQGGEIRRSLAEENIDIGGLLVRRNASSQSAFIVIEKGTGKRTIFWKRPSGEYLRPEERELRFGDCNFLLLDGLMTDISLHAAKRARAAGVPVMLDAGRVRRGMLDLAKNCDYLVGSEEFARDLGWENKPEVLQKVIKELGPAVTTITLGEKGSFTFLEHDIIHVPAFEVRTMDTTGAGDVFHGGYVFGLLKGWPVIDAVRFASAVAALKCRKIGGRTGIPELREVVSFLRKRNVILR